MDDAPSASSPPALTSRSAASSSRLSDPVRNVARAAVRSRQSRVGFLPVGLYSRPRREGVAAWVADGLVGSGSGRREGVPWVRRHAQVPNVAAYDQTQGFTLVREEQRAHVRLYMLGRKAERRDLSLWP